MALLVAIISCGLFMIHFNGQGRHDLVSMGAIGTLCAYGFVLLIFGLQTGLTDREIDSIYYFGFLITLGSLILAVITFEPSKEGSTKTLLSQFGLGVGATAAGVIFRMLLQHFEEPDEHADPNALAQEVAIALKATILEYENLTFHLKELSGRIAGSTLELEERIESAGSSITASASAYAEGMTRTINGISSTILLSEPEIRRSLDQLLNHIRGDLGSFSVAEANAAIVAELASTKKVISKSSDAISTTLESALKKFQAELSAFSLAEQVRSMKAELTEVGRASTQAKEIQLAIEQLIERIHASAETLSSSLGPIAQEMGAVASASDALESGLRSASKTTTTAATAVQEFAGATLALQPALESFAKENIDLAKQIHLEKATLAELGKKAEPL